MKAFELTAEERSDLRKAIQMRKQNETGREVRERFTAEAGIQRQIDRIHTELGLINRNGFGETRFEAIERLLDGICIGLAQLGVVVQFDEEEDA